MVVVERRSDRELKLEKVRGNELRGVREIGRGIKGLGLGLEKLKIEEERVGNVKLEREAELLLDFEARDL